MPPPSKRKGAGNSSTNPLSLPRRTQSSSSPSVAGVSMSKFGQATFTSIRARDEDNGSKSTMKNFVPLVNLEPVPIEELDQNERDKRLLSPVKPQVPPTKPKVYKFFKSRGATETVSQRCTAGTLFAEEGKKASTINISPKVEVKG